MNLAIKKGSEVHSIMMITSLLIILVGLLGLVGVACARLQSNAKAPVKGGVAFLCASLDKSSTACCYMHCQQCFDECKTNEPDSDRQEDSDCAGRRTICFQECAVESTAPRNWGTHTC